MSRKHSRLSSRVLWPPLLDVKYRFFKDGLRRASFSPLFPAHKDRTVEKLFCAVEHMRVYILMFVV